MQRSERAYKALTSYVGTSAVISVADFGDSKMTEATSAAIEFSRPGKVRIYGPAFTIISDGHKTWQSWKIEQGGAYKEVESAALAIAGMTGVAQNTPTLIPAALGMIDISWGFSEAHRKGATLQGHESVMGEDCFRVQANAGHSTWTFWVSSRDFLLRQARDEQDNQQAAELELVMRKYREAHPEPTFEEQLKTMPAEQRQKIEAMTPEQRERMRQSIDNPRPRSILRSMSLHIFTIDSVNKPWPDARFQKPQPRAAR